MKCAAVRRSQHQPRVPLRACRRRDGLKREDGVQPWHPEQQRQEADGEPLGEAEVGEVHVRRCRHHARHRRIAVHQTQPRSLLLGDDGCLPCALQRVHRELMPPTKQLDTDGNSRRAEH
eukprot:CAMPEP_0183367560 /NCGR_PEP_ID=MMETSP0164_2-20130417/92919_1 /TAXON_ID=221442 /ORGANISM="Coccolithus pelagicus ssp braarudi, Strain PLY182g" /LENGTH=118 /DNA_ID=CAMNT_0025543513 /DNA_START=186 /DNA_END=540 /DNA_ORIENTATION=+